MLEELSWQQRRGAWEPSPNDERGPFDVDYARIIHAASFRRLQGKTQILSLGDSDFYRTRLTHSLEVAQIAGGIELHLEQRHPECHTHLPGLTLIQALGFTHDLGHAPFGHGGEVALNYCMRDVGGFEGNAYTLRILARLEHYSERDGANLTRRSLLGVLKYPAKYRRCPGHLDRTLPARDTDMHQHHRSREVRAAEVLSGLRTRRCGLDTRTGGDRRQGGVSAIRQEGNGTCEDQTSVAGREYRRRCR